MKKKSVFGVGLLVFLCWLGYSSATFGRINLTANIVNFTNAAGIAKSDFGAVGASFAIVYGVGQLINGILCERLNSKIVLSSALVLSGAVSVIVGFLSNTIAICIFWGINGAIQSMLWSHTVKLISSLGDGRAVNKGLIVITTTTPVGTVLAYGVSALVTFLSIWRASFVISGAMLVLSGVLMFLFLPSSEVAKFKKPVISHKNRAFIMFLPCLVPVFICAILLNYVNHGLTTWMPNLLNEYYKMPEYFSILVTMAIPMVGMICGIVSVKFTERIKSSLITALVFAGVAAIGVSLSIIFMRFSAVLLIVGFVVGTFGAHVDNSVYTAVFPSSMRSYLGSGMLAGVIDAFCYVGTAFSSQIPAVLIEKNGYESFLVSALVVCLLFIIICGFANVMLGRCIKKFEKQKTL